MNAEIFKPDAKKVLTTLVLTVFAHLYITVSQVRRIGSFEPSAVNDFWLGNFLQGLKYVQPDNTFLKFIIFFTMAYGAVWIVSQIIDFFTNLQALAVKKMRKT